MSRKTMVPFNPDEMMKKVRAKAHRSHEDCFTRIASKTGKNVSTVRTWFRKGRMPAVDFEALNNYLGTGEPKQMEFNEAGFRDLINKPDVQNSIQKEAEIINIKANPLRLTPDVEKRFRNLCDFLDYDANETLEWIITNYMNDAKNKLNKKDLNYGGDLPWHLSTN